MPGSVAAWWPWWLYGPRPAWWVLHPRPWLWWLLRRKNGEGGLALVAGSANPFDGADVGHSSHPSLGDVDGDGALDAVVGTNRGELWFYKVQAGGKFERVTGDANPFEGINVGQSAAPFLADVDHDGVLDVVVGNKNGELWFYQGQGGGEFDRVTGDANPFEGINVGQSAAPALADFDGDGVIDTVVGNEGGELLFYKGQAQGGFNRVSGSANPFDGVNVGQSAAPSFGDLNGDGAIDAVIGNKNGELWTFKGKPKGGFDRVIGDQNPFNGLNVGQSAAPALADVNGDGYIDTVVGNKDGALLFLKG